MTDTFSVGGAQVSRLEDFRLLTGYGKFASDWNLPGQLHGFFLRSNRAHARIVAIDVTAARNHPGVRLALTGEDAVKAGCVRPLNFMNFPGRNGMRAVIPERPALAHQRVRFVGEPVALVVAESVFTAQDAAQLIEVEYQDLPCVIGPEQGSQRRRHSCTTAYPVICASHMKPAMRLLCRPHFPVLHMSPGSG